MRREAIPEEIRKLVKEIYDKKCAICGARKRLHIHHDDHDSSNNEIENLILVCAKCHGYIFHPDKAHQIINWGRSKEEW